MNLVKEATILAKGDYPGEFFKLYSEEQGTYLQVLDKRERDKHNEDLR